MRVRVRGLGALVVLAALASSAMAEEKPSDGNRVSVSLGTGPSLALSYARGVVPRVAVGAEVGATWEANVNTFDFNVWNVVFGTAFVRYQPDAVLFVDAGATAMIFSAQDDTDVTGIFAGACVTPGVRVQPFYVALRLRAGYADDGYGNSAVGAIGTALVGLSGTW